MNKCLVYYHDGKVVDLGHQPTYQEVFDIVGGYIECTPAKSWGMGSGTLIVNEEGWVKNLPVNRYAIGKCHHAFAGNIVHLIGWRTTKGK